LPSTSRRTPHSGFGGRPGQKEGAFDCQGKLFGRQGRSRREAKGSWVRSCRRVCKHAFCFHLSPCLTLTLPPRGEAALVEVPWASTTCIPPDWPQGVRTTSGQRAHFCGDVKFVKGRLVDGLVRATSGS
jgi:hypothetical protein